MVFNTGKRRHRCPRTNHSLGSEGFVIGGGGQHDLHLAPGAADCRESLGAVKSNRADHCARPSRRRECDREARTDAKDRVFALVRMRARGSGLSHPEVIFGALNEPREDKRVSARPDMLAKEDGNILYGTSSAVSGMLVGRRNRSAHLGTLI